ncbi:hypothetical protein ABBQ32_005653 [Trebouxia sp. C0010 RCD-2024]
MQHIGLWDLRRESCFGDRYQTRLFGIQGRRAHALSSFVRVQQQCLFDMACDRQLRALSDCHRKHPRQAELVCRQIQASAAWCVMSQLCPEQAAALEDCGGCSRKGLPPRLIRRQCQAAADSLTQCMDAHQQQATT